MVNESVFKNSTVAASCLTMKHCSMCFHYAIECVMIKMLMPFKVGTNFNLADTLLTKSSPGNKRKNIKSMIIPSNGN